MEPDETEESLIARSRQGDLDAFNRLVERYQRAVYNLCLRLLTSPPVAADAAQDTFIAAYQGFGSFRGGSFRAWLLRIAVNTCYDELRRRRSRPTVSLEAPAGPNQQPVEFPHPGEAPEDHVQQQELARYLQEALAALPLDLRLAVLLRDVQGLSYEEVAQATGSSLGTVKSRISRGRSRLRAILLARRELFSAFLRLP